MPNSASSLFNLTSEQDGDDSLFSFHSNLPQNQAAEDASVSVASPTKKNTPLQKVKNFTVFVKYLTLALSTWGCEAAWRWCPSERQRRVDRERFSSQKSLLFSYFFKTCLFLPKILDQDVISANVTSAKKNTPVAKVTLWVIRLVKRLAYASCVTWGWGATRSGCRCKHGCSVRRENQPLQESKRVHIFSVALLDNIWN